MDILAHRGVWLTEDEKNTYISFQRAFEDGFGIETDLRDYKGEIVISHDVVLDNVVKAKDLFDLYKNIGVNVRLALNVKSDGIQAQLRKLLIDYDITNYFMFDMSIPEMVVYNEMNFCFYCRQSDIEQECVLYENAVGVWMDSFYNFEWMTENIIAYHKKNGRKICIVSPELHKKDYLSVWNWVKKLKNDMGIDIEICTDRPIEAKEFFYEKN